jgi:hypothetical protein
MHKYKYCLDGIQHEIYSQEPIPTANRDNVIPISKEQNQTAKELKELLREWIRIAEKNNIDWFCNGGTLLGAIRDKGLIHYDNDLDLCFFFKDYEKIKNAVCSDKFVINVCEQGFQLNYKSKTFPFIDLWLNAPNPENPNEIILACPYVNNRLTYWFSKMWPNDKYLKQDVSHCKKLSFEGITVNVPKNYKQYVKRMYGDDCLTRYVISPHTYTHTYGNDILPMKIRMLIWETIDKIDPITCRTVGSLLTNQLIMQEKDKFKNNLTIISMHINDKLQI